MDESTPHAHWGAVPIKDGRLSWKAFFDGRGGLSAFQDRCFEKVGKPWGLDRGEKHSGRRYRETAEMKRDLEQEVEKDARAADRVIKREVKSVRKELGALAAEAQQMRKSGKQLESERASGRPESRSKGVDR